MSNARVAPVALHYTFVRYGIVPLRAQFPGGRVLARLSDAVAILPVVVTFRVSALRFRHVCKLLHSSMVMYRAMPLISRPSQQRRIEHAARSCAHECSKGGRSKNPSARRGRSPGTTGDSIKGPRCTKPGQVAEDARNATRSAGVYGATPYHAASRRGSS